MVSTLENHNVQDQQQSLVLCFGEYHTNIQPQANLLKTLLFKNEIQYNIYLIPDSLLGGDKFVTESWQSLSTLILLCLLYRIIQTL